jgi:hypothetical protein
MCEVLGGFFGGGVWGKKQESPVPSQCSATESLMADREEGSHRKQPSQEDGGGGVEQKRVSLVGPHKRKNSLVVDKTGSGTDSLGSGPSTTGSVT